MGKVVVAARIESLEDLYDVQKGRLTADKVRTVQVDDALVDTGATLVSLPRSLIERLGLRRLRTRTAQTAAGVFSFGIFGPVQLTVQDRECVVEAGERAHGV